MFNLVLVQCFLAGVLTTSLLNSPPPTKRARTTKICAIFDRLAQFHNPSVSSNSTANDSDTIDVVCFLKEAYSRLQNVKRIYEIDKNLISNSSESVQWHLDNIQRVIVGINVILNPIDDLNPKTEPDSINDEESYISSLLSQTFGKKTINPSCNDNPIDISSSFSPDTVQNESISLNSQSTTSSSSTPSCPIFYIGKSLSTEKIERTFNACYLYYNALTHVQQNVYIRTNTFNDILFLPYISRVLKYYDLSATDSERRFSEFGEFLYECISPVKKSERPLGYAFESRGKGHLSSTFNMDSYLFLTMLAYPSKLLTKENMQKFSENIQKLAKSFSHLISQDMSISLFQTLKQSFKVPFTFQQTSSSIVFADCHILNLLYQQKQNGNPVFKLIWNDILFTSYQYDSNELSKVFYCQFLIAIDQFLLDNSVQIINRLNELFIEFQAFIFDCKICFFNQKYVDKCNSFFEIFQQRFSVDENCPSLKQCLESVWKVYSFQYKLYIMKKFSLLNQLKINGERYLKDNETALRSCNPSVFINAFRNVINLIEPMQSNESDKNTLNKYKESSTLSASSHLHSKAITISLPTINEAIQMHLYLLDFLNNTIDYESIGQIVENYSRNLDAVSDLPKRMMYELFFNRIYMAIKENSSMDRLMIEFESRRNDFVDICKCFFKKNYLQSLKENPHEFFSCLLDFFILKDLI